MGVYEKYSDAENILKILKNSETYERIKSILHIKLKHIDSIYKYINELNTTQSERQPIYFNNIHINKFYPESMYTKLNNNIDVNNVEKFIYGNIIDDEDTL